MKETNSYSDIIDLPAHKSAKHPKMSMNDRAAQFSPFAALTGFAGRITEVSRLTHSKPEITDEQKNAINSAIRLVSEMDIKPEVRLVYYKPDCRKEGGEIIEVYSAVKAAASEPAHIILSDGTQVDIKDIIEIDF